MFMQTEAVQFYQILIVRMLQNQLEGKRSKGKLETEMCDADLWGVMEVEVGWDPSKCNAQLVQELLCSSTRRNNPEGKYICGYSWYTAYIFVNGSRGERGDGSIGGGGWPRGEKGKWEDYSVSESPTSSQLLYSIKIMTYRVMNFVVIIMVSLSDGLQTKTSIQPSIEKS